MYYLFKIIISIIYFLISYYFIKLIPLFSFIIILLFKYQNLLLKRFLFKYFLILKSFLSKQKKDDQENAVNNCILCILNKI